MDVQINSLFDETYIEKYWNEMSQNVFLKFVHNLLVWWKFCEIMPYI